MLFARNKNKVFIIGQNKTGTTSAGHALEAMGYRMGSQFQAELLLEDWAKRDFARLIQYCKKSDAFQDVPFSLEYTYEAMDQAFPRAKFILTVRDNPSVWYESLVRFQTQLLGTRERPTADDLKSHVYLGKLPGWIWRYHQLAFGADEETLYDRTKYINRYESHNQRVQDYFRYRPDDLLVLNLSDTNSIEKLGKFLGKRVDGQKMPHMNRSQQDK